MRPSEATTPPPSPDIPSVAFDARPSWPPPTPTPTPTNVALEVISSPSESHGWNQGPMDSPSIEGVLPGDDVCAVPAHEELDAVIEGVQVLLGHRGWKLGAPCRVDDVQWVRGAQAEWVDMTEGLEAAVGVHAVDQTICRGDRA